MKNKLLFISLGVLILLIASFIMIFNSFPIPFHGLLRIIVLFATAVMLTIIISLTASWAEKKIPPVTLQSTEDEPVDILFHCKNQIDNYLNENKSTPFFRDILGQISSQVISFQKRHYNMHTALEGRFGVGGLSYSRFSSAVDTQQNLIVKLIYNLLLKLKSFDEDEYEEKINRFMVMNRLEEAEAHKAVEKEYKTHAEGVSRHLDNAILKMDKLILEMARLNDADLAKAMSILCNIDDVIKDTKLYGV